MSDPDGRLRGSGVAALAGVGSFLLGYVITYGWKANAVERALEPLNVAADLFGGDPIPAWKVVGWLFFGAHFVPTTIEVGPLGPRTVDLIAASTGSLELLYLLPPVLLLVAGGLVGWRTDRLSSVGDRALAGAAVALGYAPAALLTVALVRIGESGPGIVRTALIAAVLYPVVFGVSGALVAGRLRR